MADTSLVSWRFARGAHVRYGGAVWRILERHYAEGQRDGRPRTWQTYGLVDLSEAARTLEDPLLLIDEHSLEEVPP